MVRSSLALSLVAAAAAASVAGATADKPAPDVLPGAYIFEIKEGPCRCLAPHGLPGLSEGPARGGLQLRRARQDPATVYRAVEKEGQTRLKLDFELFKGVLVQMDDVKRANKTAADIASLPAVKDLWPMRLYKMPDPKVEWIGTAAPRGRGAAERRAVATGSSDKANGTGAGPSGAVDADAWVAALRMASHERTTRSLLSTPNAATGGALSAFTSWGPSWEMDLKPQLAAPGGNILSTYPRALGAYAVLSGTSMACPLAAAALALVAVALVAQARASYYPALLSALLSATAEPRRFNNGSAFRHYLAPAAQQGAGLVRAWDAAHASSLLRPLALSFNDTDHFAPTLNFTLTNLGRAPLSYRLRHRPAITVYTFKPGLAPRAPAPFPNGAVDAPAPVLLSHDALRLAPGQSCTVDVSPTPPPGLDAARLALWSGWIVVDASDGSSLSIPYQGLTGSLHNTRVLGPADTWIALSTDKKLKPVADNHTFTLPGPGNAIPGSSELPALVAKLALGSPLIRAHIVPLTPCPPNMMSEVWGVKTIGQPFGFPSKWNTRGPGAFPWDGRLNSGNYAPPSKYKFIVRALRIFGNADDENEWDVSESPALRIKYA